MSKNIQLTELHTGTDDKEIQYYIDETINMCDNGFKYHYVGFCGDIKNYSGAHSRQISAGSGVPKFFFKVIDSGLPDCSYPRASYSFIPVKLKNHGFTFDFSKADEYFREVARLNDYYFKTSTIVIEFGEFEHRQDHVYEAVKETMLNAFAQSEFIEKVIVLLDYDHPFYKGKVHNF
ncbi:MAG: hypothetical protein HUJ58_01090 [Erysipelotrichaceae bacterium]|nr:hypothetical protein [Erysipelotrichaceae bacterium]